MSKIICDVCGTSYQDSAQQCPICGCVRPSAAEADVLTNDHQFQKSEKYTYVKGGRFSKANVQKRNQALLHENTNDTTNVEKSASKGGKGDKGLVIAACALLLAIVGVAIFAVDQGLAAIIDALVGLASKEEVTETTTKAANMISLFLMK